MKRRIIRALWGNAEKVIKDIDNAIKVEKYLGMDFTCYTMGLENHKLLQNKGVESFLINDNPVLFENHWRHKLEIFRYAMEDYDEIVYLDWDVNPLIVIPDNFWDKLNEKEVIQGCLYAWRRGICRFRKEKDERRYIINGGFIYMRDKSIPNKLISLWEVRKPIMDEVTISQYIDSLTNGWKGCIYWLRHYEPEMCQLMLAPVFNNYNHYFRHI